MMIKKSKRLFCLLLIFTMLISVFPSYAGDDSSGESIQSTSSGASEESGSGAEEESATQETSSDNTQENTQIEETFATSPSEGGSESLPRESLTENIPSEGASENASSESLSEIQGDASSSEGLSEGNTTYTNSISGMLWYDENSDGTRDEGETGIANYPVYLYKADDTNNAVQTVTTDEDGKYTFTDIEPCDYVVGVKSNELGTDYYLLPIKAVTGDNKLGTWSDGWDEKYSDTITIDANSMVTDVSAGLRTPPGVEPMTESLTFNSVTAAATSFTINFSYRSESTYTMVYCEYGTTTSYGSTVSIGGGALTSGTLTLGKAVTYLYPNTTYYFRIYMKNGNSYYYYSSQQIVTTTNAVATTAATNITSTTATLNGTYDVGLWYATGSSTYCRFYFDYGTTTSFGKQTSIYNYCTATSASGSVSVTGLSPGTTYYFRAVVRIGSNSYYYGDTLSFMTVGASTSAATNITATSATLNGKYCTGGVTGSVYFQYGTSSSLGTTSTSSSASASTEATKSLTLTGLTAYTTYYFRIVVVVSGTTYNGSTLSFTTIGAATSAATNITDTSAILNGTYSSGSSSGTVYFQYGITSSLGNTTSTTLVSESTSKVSFSLSLTGLSQYTTYYFRMVAVIGGTTYTGDTLSFSTYGTPEAVTTGSSAIGATSATLEGTYNTGGYIGSVYFEYGTSSSFGSTTTSNTLTSTSATPSAVTVPSLSPNSTYYFRMAVVANSSIYTGSTFNFTTLPSITSLTGAATGTTTADITAVFESGMNNVYPSAVSIEYSNTNSINSATSVSIGSGSTYASGFTNFGLTGLTPNTIYYLWTTETNDGGMTTYPDASTSTIEVLTYPDFTTWDVNGSPTGVTVSGSYYTGDSITAATVVYGTSPTLSSGSETTLNGDKNTIISGDFVYTDSGFSCDLTGLIMGTTYYVETTVTNASGTTTSSIKSFTAGYTVTENYYNESGTLIQSPTTESVPITSGTVDYLYNKTGYESIMTASNYYVYQGYTVGTYDPATSIVLSGIPQITGLTGDAIVSLVYKEYSTTIDVTLPTMDFYVNSSTAGALNNGDGSTYSLDYYEVINNSDLPVKMELTEVKIGTNGLDGINFVDSLTPPGADEVQLNLDVYNGATLTPNTNGFDTTVSISGLVPGTPYAPGTAVLGILDGVYVKQSTTSSQYGYVNLSGLFGGLSSTGDRKPHLTLTFTFDLVV